MLDFFLSHIFSVRYTAAFLGGYIIPGKHSNRTDLNSEHRAPELRLWTNADEPSQWQLCRFELQRCSRR